jgi:outer membrane receptor protein involved in Fe transport
MKQYHIILLGLLATLPRITAAQAPVVADTTIRATKIEITQIYRPKVKQADKERLNPVLPPRNETLPHFEYEVPQYSPSYSYKPLPLQALALIKDSAAPGFRHYIQVGAGNRHTIIAEAGTEVYADRYNKVQLQGSVLTQKSSLAYQQQTYGNLDGRYAYRKKEFVAQVDLDFLHRGGYQYGYDHDAQPGKIPAKSNLTGAGVEGVLMKGIDSIGWQQELNVGLSYFTGTAFDYERSEHLGIGVRRHFKEKGLQLVFNASVRGTEYQSPMFATTQNNLGMLSAGMDYKKGDWRLHAALSPSLGQKGNSWLLQDLAIEWTADSTTKVIVGTEGRIQRNTFRELFLRNPFIGTVPTIQSHSNEFYLAFQRNFGAHISLHLRGSYWRYENLASFLNAPGKQSEQMTVVYLPRVSAVSLQGGMRYQVAEDLSVGVQFSLYNYTKVSFDNKVWHTPNTRVDGDFLWHPLRNLSVTAYISYVGGNFGIDSSSITKKLNAYADLGMGAEWNVVKNISVFAVVNNLLNSKYERWLGYRAYGINIFGGVRLKLR